MLHDVVEVQALSDYRLRLRFDDGVEGLVDVRELVPFVGIFEPLGQPEFFSDVRLSSDLGTIVWPNGADLDPQVLYAEIVRRDMGAAKA
jgi:Protein of unknown function (DUF2442)